MESNLTLSVVSKIIDFLDRYSSFSYGMES